MLDFNKEKKNCTGCAACYSACPIHCITMKTDSEGFLYPEASDACVHCGLCARVCPAFQPKRDLTIEQKAWAVVTKDQVIWQRSASGGAFSEICRHWADDDTLIVGAAWDGLKVHHVGVNGFKNIEPLCKSKYMSSAIEDTFIQIQEALSLGRKALFCGCPCQVAGLKMFLHKNYENLLTIDLICHGQGSPSVFEACVEKMSDDLGERILQYEFRAKRSRYEEDYLCYIKTSKSEHFIIRDPYMQLFLSQNALRPSCGENCKYRDKRRPGDLTIADFKGYDKLFPDLSYPSKNWSTVVCNTPKGAKCLEKLSLTMERREIEINDVIKYNPLFAKQTWFSKDRDSFFEDFENDAESAIEKWTIPLTIYRPAFPKKVLTYLPRSVKYIILNILNSIRRTNNLTC